MISSAAKRVASSLTGRLEADIGRPLFEPRTRYTSFDFDPENFHSISQRSGPTVAALDGGNLPLITTPSSCVHFCRIYFNLFRGMDRVTPSKLPSRVDFFTVVRSSGAPEDISYSVDLFPLDEAHRNLLPDESDLVFSSLDETMSPGRERVNISTIGGVARSFSEWNYAKLIMDSELETGDVFVRDGALHPAYTNEAKYAEAAYTTAREKSIIFTGVSKTSHLYTTTGYPLGAAIARLARENSISGAWYYDHIVDIDDPAHQADLSFAKFNRNSGYVFRVEVLKSQESAKANAFSALALQSTDISFPGYPYCLVDADKNARVSNHELEPLRMLLFSEVSKTNGWDRFRELLAASDAHDWLNKIV